MAYEQLLTEYEQANTAAVKDVPLILGCLELLAAKAPSKADKLAWLKKLYEQFDQLRQFDDCDSLVPRISELEPNNFAMNFSSIKRALEDKDPWTVFDAFTQFMRTQAIVRQFI